MDQNHGRNNKDGSLKDLWLGIALTLAIYLIGALLLPSIIQNLFISIVTALVVHIVLIVLSFVKGRKRFGQGLLIGLGITLLLVAACFGIIFTSLSGG